MTDEDEENFQKAEKCHIWDKKNMLIKIFVLETFVILAENTIDLVIKIVI